MSNTNPLNKYFRQPKIYISLPSKGLNYPPGVLNGDYNNVPIFAMTGMDEILFKTPDALFNGEASVKVIESCCPYISDAKQMPSIDVDAVLVAIRIATNGNTMTVTHTCTGCESVSDYDIDLGNVIQHFSGLEYDNKIVLKDVAIKIQPLNYKQWNEFQLKNFGVQRQLAQAMRIDNEDEQSKLIAGLFEQVSAIQTEMMFAQIDSVETSDGVVNQREFIREWLQNSEKQIFDAIRDQVEKNRIAWKIPSIGVECPECSAKNQVQLDMDQASFFANA
jgi:hypothetical protein